MILYGAGGHARVVYESLGSSGTKVTAVFDDDQRIEIFEGLPVWHSYDQKYLKNEQLVVAIGSNQSRLRLSSIIKHHFGNAIDPTSFISKSAMVGCGVMILPKSILQSGVRIGDHVIVNSGAIVEHDTEVQGFCHLGPGSVLCGGVTVGTGSMIGANTTVLPGVKIGAWAIVGAGAVVVKDVPPGMKAVGNPAKILESNAART